jgi:5-methylcytosine-specific restriction protein A
MRPFKPCASPGCREPVRDTPRCPLHTTQRATEKRKQARAYDKRRGSPASRGYDARWSAFSKWWRQTREPLCRECRGEGRRKAAEVVDHIRPWQSGSTPAEQERLKYAPENLRALCVPCHNRKTAERDGGLGNPRR